MLKRGNLQDHDKRLWKACDLPQEHSWQTRNLGWVLCQGEQHDASFFASSSSNLWNVVLFCLHFHFLCLMIVCAVSWAWGQAHQNTCICMIGSIPGVFLPYVQPALLGHPTGLFWQCHFSPKGGVAACGQIFPIVAPQWWNPIKGELRTAPSLMTFWQGLKTSGLKISSMWLLNRYSNPVRLWTCSPLAQINVLGLAFYVLLLNVKINIFNASYLLRYLVMELYKSS